MLFVELAGKQRALADGCFGGGIEGIRSIEIRVAIAPAYAGGQSVGEKRRGQRRTHRRRQRMVGVRKTCADPDAFG